LDLSSSLPLGYEDVAFEVPRAHPPGPSPAPAGAAAVTGARCTILLRVLRTRAGSALRRPASHIIALQSAQGFINPVSQLVLVSAFGITAFGVYLAAQTLAFALQRLIAFGVADFAVRELIRADERRHVVFKALVVFRSLVFVATTLVMWGVFALFNFGDEYALYFWLFWIIQFSVLVNKIVDAQARALGEMRFLRLLALLRLLIDVVALLAVLAGSVGYVGFILVRVVGFTALLGVELWHYRGDLAGLWASRRAVFATWRETFSLSLFYGVSNTLRELTAQWLLVAYSFLVPSDTFGLVGLAWRFVTAIWVVLNRVINIVTLPRLIHATSAPPATFFRVYRRLQLMHVALGAAATTLIGVLLVLTEQFVLDPGESYGIAFIASIVLYGVTMTLMVVPVKLIAAAGRVRERIPQQIVVAVLSYAVLAGASVVAPFYALNLARIVSVLATYVAIRPVVRRITREMHAAPADPATQRTTAVPAS
jgi:hypothetical protein